MTDQSHSLTTLVELLLQANAARHEEDYRAAVAFYRTIVEQYGEKAELLHVIARCYLWLAESKSGTTQDGIEFIVWNKKAIESMPNNAHLYAELGEYYSIAAHDYEQAVQAYRAALEIDPVDLKALIGIASLYGVPEDVVTLDDSIRFLERAIQIEGCEPNYLFRLGELYYEAGRISDARQVWHRALLCPQPLNVRTSQVIRTRLRETKE